MQIHAYLTFPGNCEAAFDFYKTALGGKIEMMMKHDEAPPGGPALPVEWRGKIMHASLVVDDTQLMGSDARPEHYEQPAGFNVSLAIDEPARAETLFASLAEGGTVTMALQQTFWARKFGMVTDRFGIPWMINCA